ncbi:unnamed protein product [Tenebrio molitor]|nr:unnamed protein product [Tenebrio molitor]
MPRSGLGYHLPPIRQECGVQVDKLDTGAPTMRFGPAILSGSRNPEPKKPDEPLDANNTERLLPSERSRDRLGPTPRNQEMKKRFHSNFPTSHTDISAQLVNASMFCFLLIILLLFCLVLL